jgi:hypothetical protein
LIIQRRQKKLFNIIRNIFLINFLNQFDNKFFNEFDKFKFNVSIFSLK